MNEIFVSSCSGDDSGLGRPRQTSERTVRPWDSRTSPTRSARPSRRHGLWVDGRAATGTAPPCGCGLRRPASRSVSPPDEPLGRWGCSGWVGRTRFGHGTAWRCGGHRAQWAHTGRPDARVDGAGLGHAGHRVGPVAGVSRPRRRHAQRRRDIGADRRRRASADGAGLYRADRSGAAGVPIPLRSGRSCCNVTRHMFRPHKYSLAQVPTGQVPAAKGSTASKMRGVRMKFGGSHTG